MAKKATKKAAKAEPKAKAELQKPKPKAKPKAPPKPPRAPTPSETEEIQRAWIGGKLKASKFADLLPMQSVDESEALVLRMIERGYDRRHPITLTRKGKGWEVLDGRNRLGAVEKARDLHEQISTLNDVAFVEKYNDALLGMGEEDDLPLLELRKRNLDRVELQAWLSPSWEVFEGTEVEALDLVVGENLSRRNMSVGAIALALVGIYNVEVELGVRARKAKKSDPGQGTLELAVADLEDLEVPIGRVRERLASEHGVSASSIARAQYVTQHAKVVGEYVLDQIREGQVELGKVEKAIRAKLKEREKAKADKAEKKVKPPTQKAIAQFKPPGWVEPTWERGRVKVWTAKNAEAAHEHDRQFIASLADETTKAVFFAADGLDLDSWYGEQLNQLSAHLEKSGRAHVFALGDRHAIHMLGQGWEKKAKDKGLRLQADIVWYDPDRPEHETVLWLSFDRAEPGFPKGTGSVWLPTDPEDRGGKRPRALLARLLLLAGVSEGDTILDIGCGVASLAAVECIVDLEVRALVDETWLATIQQAVAGVMGNPREQAAANA